MTDSVSTRRTAGLGVVTWILAAWGVAATLLVFGGSYQSLILIGAGSVVFFGSIVWMERGSQMSVLRRILPATVGIYLVVSAMYFGSQLVWWAGFLLIVGDVIWVNRSALRDLANRAVRNND